MPLQVYSGVTLKDVSIDGSGVSGIRVEASQFERCTFVRFDLANATFGAGGSQSIYRDCVFAGLAVASAVFVGNARFEACRFEDARLSDWFSFHAEYVRCSFTGKILGGAIAATDPELRGATGRRQNEVTGNDFSGCELIDFEFRGGVDLATQRLPTGPSYGFIPDLRRAIAYLRSIEQGTLAAEANVEAASLDWLLSGGQEAHFAHLPSLCHDKGAGARLAEMMVGSGVLRRSTAARDPGCAGWDS